MKIKLQDGQVIDNLTLNGNNYVSKKIIDSSIFENNLERVEIIDGEITQVYNNMKLIQCKEYGTETWFILAEKSEQEIKNEQKEIISRYMGIDIIRRYRMSELKISGYIRLIEAGRKTIDDIPEPYKSEIKKRLNL